MTGSTTELPEGFVELPGSAATADVQRELEGLFGLPAGDTSAAKVAESLTVLGLIAADSGAQHTSVGFFRSPDDPQRPVGVVLTASRMASDHDDSATVVAGLREVYAADPDTDAEVLQLPGGRALATIREEPAMLEIEGIAPVPVLQRQVLAWIPDPAGSAVAGSASRPTPGRTGRTSATSRWTSSNRSPGRTQRRGKAQRKITLHQSLTLRVIEYERHAGSIRPEQCSGVPILSWAIRADC